jgi:hypothetical protein
MPYADGKPFRNPLLGKASVYARASFVSHLRVGFHGTPEVDVGAPYGKSGWTMSLGIMMSVWTNG